MLQHSQVAQIGRVDEFYSFLAYGFSFPAILHSLLRTGDPYTHHPEEEAEGAREPGSPLSLLCP